MNIENYKTFLELSCIQNYSRTAEKLNVVQSTVSSRILELEKYLDVELFKRNNRKIEITEAGIALIPYARKLVNTECEGKRNIKSIGLYVDHLRLGIPGSVFREKISSLVYKYYNQYPQFTVDIRFHKTSKQLEMIMNDEIDIGFISRIPSTNKLIIEPYIKYSWILVANNDYIIEDSIDVEQLFSINLCYNNLNEEYNEWLYDILPKGFRSRINMNSTAQLIEYVMKGYGCAFLPEYAVSEDISNGKMKEINIIGIKKNEFNIYLAINKKRVESHAVKSFLDTLNNMQ